MSSDQPTETSKTQGKKTTDRLKGFMVRIGHAWNSKTVPNNRLIFQASLVVIVVVNVFVIFTVLLSLSQPLRWQLPEPLGIRTLVVTLIAFMVSLGSSMISQFQANEDLRGLWTLVAFLAFMIGLVYLVSVLSWFS